ncbi:hypothetical protein BRD17_08695 [Halobacteriales archaeon SW_7_68_16]|nr:MAG: hypothetical protein BRD17_08695 [Halobacteriales archaeon SW_7_68_16]
MYGGGLGKEVIQHVRDWIPADNHPDRAGFKTELRDFLDAELNDDAGAMGTGFGGSDGPRAVFTGGAEVRTDHGPVDADVAVDDEVGVLVYHELSREDVARLPDRIEAYKREYGTVVVVACGVRDTSGWDEIQDDYISETFAVTDGPEVQFVTKDKRNFGRDPADDEDDGGFLGNWFS